MKNRIVAVAVLLVMLTLAITANVHWSAAQPSTALAYAARQAEYLMSDPVISSYFDSTTTENWTADYGTITNPGSNGSGGGTANGYLRISPPGDSRTSYFMAPPAYHGDWRNFSELKFDMWSQGGSYYSSGHGMHGDVYLASNDKYAYRLLPGRPHASWESFAIRLDSGDGWTLGGGAGSLNEVLSNVTSFQLRAEYGVGSDTTGLDSVEVFGQDATSSPTETSTFTPTDTPTYTNTPTRTSTPTATASPTATPSSGPGVPTATPPLPTPTATPNFPICTVTIDKIAYPNPAQIDGQVGVTLRLTGDCPGEIGAAVDVALVIDRSQSMCGAKLTQAQAAGQAFLDNMALPPDQASIVSFAGTATLHTGLTTNRTQATNALYNITCGGISRIDAGLNRAFDEMTGPRRVAGHTPAVILLTDGNPQGSYVDDVRAAAGACTTPVSNSIRSAWAPTSTPLCCAKSPRHPTTTTNRHRLTT